MHETSRFKVQFFLNSTKICSTSVLDVLEGLGGLGLVALGVVGGELLDRHGLDDLAGLVRSVLQHDDAADRDVLDGP